MGGGPVREQTRRMTFPTVVEITPQPEAVTPDTFIDGLTGPTTGEGFTRLDGDGRPAAMRAPVSAAADHRPRP
jgi:hypothetical protein